MKKVYIKEESLVNMNTNRILPNFLFKRLKSHTTSLGDNDAFPSGDDFDFDYTVIKRRFCDVSDEIEKLNLESLDEDYLMSEMSRLVKECKEREKPMKDTLIKMCENLVNRLFAIPEDLISMKFELVDKVEFKNDPRIEPEPTEKIGHIFKDTDEISVAKKSIAKRRFTNSLIQGASYTYMKQLLDDEELNSICNDLIDLYRVIIIINDYLLFIKKENITDKKPMQGAYVETHIGSNGKRTIINVQGIIFPLLLQESIRGLFELFSSHGLPKNNKKANYILKKADFLLAEPWDMRFGVELWDRMFGDIEDTNIIPYVFMLFVKMPSDEFNKSAKEILANTKLGNEIKTNLIKDATYNSGYQEFTNRVNARNVNKAVINDGYFSAAEIDGLELDDTSINDIITDANENEEETIFEIVVNDNTSDVELDVDDLIQKNEKFKEWFSENGLTDENGNPLLVYHGSGKDFSAFDINTTYDGKICFSPNKKDAISYTHWDNGDDNWRTINDAYQYLNDEGYILNNKLGYPEKMNLLNMVNGKTGKPIDKQYAYDVIYEFYNEQYKNPTLYYCFIRNAEENEYYSDEYNVYDDDDIWVVKKERINYKPMPKLFGDGLNTYIE